MGFAWLTAAFGIWAFGRTAGFYAGLCMATCVGLFLFTRILIPDVMLTFTIALAMWAFLRVLDEEEPHPRLWAFVLAASLGAGLLLKSLIARVFPGRRRRLLYLLLTRQLFSARTWKRLHPFSGAARYPADRRALAHSGDAAQSAVFRLHDAQRPRRVSRLPVVLLHQRAAAALPEPALSARLQHRPAPLLLAVSSDLAVSLERLSSGVAKLSFKPVDRAGRTRLLALCWIGFILVFFTFSTTQEYYSMPCYPALALLLGSAMAMERRLDQAGNARADGRLPRAPRWLHSRSLVLFAIVPAPGDISSRVIAHPEAYTLSLGHMEDLTLQSFAYLRVPLLLAALAFLIGALGNLRAHGPACFSRGGPDDGAVFPGGAPGAGGLRSLSFLAAAGRGAAASARRHI